MFVLFDVFVWCTSSFNQSFFKGVITIFLRMFWVKKRVTHLLDTFNVIKFSNILTITSSLSNDKIFRQ